MTWKDDWREHKEGTGLSWAEYHDRWFVHRSEIDELHEQIERLDKHLQAATESYKQMHRDVFEKHIMEQYDE